MKRPGITIQLFIAVLTMAILVALAVGGAAQWNFQRGFMGYLNAQAVEHMEALVPRVQQAYVEHGSWAFLHDQIETWGRIIGVVPGRADAAWPRSIQEERRENGSDWMGASRRLSLLDEHGRHIIGFPFLLPDTEERDIVVDGRVVGKLAMAPVETVADTAALQFVEAQRRATMVVALAAMGLAAAIAWWIARTLLAPVRVVAAGTHELAAGRFGTRVPVRGQDVVAQLSRDFNLLAGALERHEQLRREWMADVSHELRTPLTLLKGELEAVEDGVHALTPELVSLLQAKVATLGQLVHHLHELALADAGALAYRKAVVDLAGLVMEESALARGLCDERGIALRVQVVPAPCLVHADALRLRQLMHNLLENAARYTDRGGEVQVRLATREGEAILDVLDSAPGVPEELLPRLTERFFRVEGSRSRQGGGSGLGLAICQSIVSAHGGSLTARPSPLGGVWIEARLPLEAGRPAP